jgi:F-type H+-transporting ATPase subunit b
MVLNQFLFKPLRKIIDERERRTAEAKGALDDARAVQEQRLAEIELRLKEARREAYEIRDASQRSGRAQRDALMAEARQQAHEVVEQAREEIAADVKTARTDLGAEAERLSKLIADRVLGKAVAGDGGDAS